MHEHRAHVGYIQTVVVTDHCINDTDVSLCILFRKLQQQVKRTLVHQCQDRMHFKGVDKGGGGARGALHTIFFSHFMLASQPPTLTNLSTPLHFPTFQLYQFQVTDR